jgi:hypothetical protein
VATLPWTNDLEAGSAGTTLATTPGAFTTITTGASVTFDYSATQAHGGALAARIVQPATPAITFGEASGFGIAGGVDVFARGYFFFPALPAADAQLFIFRTAAAANSARLRIASTGFISALNAAGNGTGTAGTVQVATNQWVRIEFRVNASTTVGQVEWWLYNNAESLTASDTASATAQVLGADTDALRVGTGSASPASFTFYFDDLAASTTGPIGPVATSAATTTFIPRRMPLGV